MVERKKSALIVLGLWGEEVGPLGVSCSLSRYYIMFIQEEVLSAEDLVAETIGPSDGFCGRRVIDNRVADVSGNRPLITVPKEPLIGVQHPPVRPSHQPIHHWLKLRAALECQRPSVDGI
ncbi:hypothetical protein JOQ06_000915, partial [Pogonophryne albipinna]